jgi:multiple sugar transport system substrate-binding protein
MRHPLRLLALTLAVLGFAAAQDVTLDALFMQQAAYSNDDIRNMTAEFEADHPGVTVDLEFVSYEALHNKIVTAAAAGSGGYDVVLFDVIWSAEFAEYGILVDLTDRISQETIDAVVPGAWTTVMSEGHYYGMPWILDTKYLFFNRAMMADAGFDAPPTTWSELLDQARVIKEMGTVEYPIVWSWGQAEAMVCDYTTLLSAYGGDFFEGAEPAFQQDGGLEALRFMTDSLEAGLSNPSSTESLEEDVRRIFSSGEAAFALNWTYMYNLANDPAESQVAGQVGVAPAPGVEGVSELSAMNGSMGLGVTTTSEHPDLAYEYVAYLTSRPVQERYACLSLPIWEASYDEPAVVEGQEDLVAVAKQALGAMYPRPLMIQYPEFSTVLQEQLQNALLGRVTPEEALQATARQVRERDLR